VRVDTGVAVVVVAVVAVVAVVVAAVVAVVVAVVAAVVETGGINGVQLRAWHTQNDGASSQVRQFVSDVAF
jgi:hypothetical protein